MRPAPTGEPVPPPKPDKKESSSAQPARLIVEVPAAAQLFIDDQPMKTASARRVFSTPVLEPGQAYYYIVRAEVVRDGRAYSESKRVIVRAGEETRASFQELVAEVTPTLEATAAR
jgi:uncharacterized protein (TIGR03000 family)